MSVKILYQDVAVGAAEDAEIITYDATKFSDPEKLPFDSAADDPIATLEVNKWRLDGKHKFLDQRRVVFWSKEMSGEDCLFSAPPKIRVDFDEQYTSLGIYLRFDPTTGEYCTDITIRWYQGETLLAEKNFHPDSVDYFCEQAVIAYNRVEIQLNETKLPYRYARLSKVMFGILRVFERDELRSVKVVEEVNIISSEVAINTLDYELDSKNNVEYLFQLKQPVLAYDKDALIGVFYIDGSSRKGERIYNISCIDAIGVLDESRFPAAIYTDYPAKTLLTEILDGRFALDLAPDLEDAAITGYIPECTRREALQQVAFALCAVADTSGTDAVRVYKVSAENASEVPLNRLYTGGSVNTAAIVTAVRVTAHSYSTEENGNDTVEIDGTTYYHTTADTTIENPNVTASDKQNIIYVKDATLVNPANVGNVARHVYDYYMRRDTWSGKIVMHGEKPGDCISVTTPWDTGIAGNVTRMDITLSGIAAASVDVVGV